MIGDAGRILVPIMVVIFVLGSCSQFGDESINVDHVSAPGLDFDYISISDNRIRTLHNLKYEVAMTRDFVVIKPKNRVDQFDNIPYKISLAAFIGSDSALMIHAEEVADSSGASDYGHLAPADWPDGTFRSSGSACLRIPAQEVEEEHDLLWLRQNGFEPSGNILYAQYFATTADMNTELVISLLQQVPSCDQVFVNSKLIGELQAKTSIKKIE